MVTGLYADWSLTNMGQCPTPAQRTYVNVQCLCCDGQGDCDHETNVQYSANCSFVES